ncbi:hypothetical protein I552_7434 [Mycobacterium xenopi 3993]|nr:hypothetical protein I552_7434 [Mycobacterium xenopi 3993]
MIALHRKVGTSVVVDLRLKGLKEPRESDIWLLGAIGPRMVYSTNLDAARRACDRRMVTFAHTAPDCAEIMWNEQNWTLVSMPISSGRAEWDEGLRTVRQFNDLLRVLPPVPQQMSQPAPAVTPRQAARWLPPPAAIWRLGAPRMAFVARRPNLPAPTRVAQHPLSARPPAKGQQAPHYQR